MPFGVHSVLGQLWGISQQSRGLPGTRGSAKHAEEDTLDFTAPHKGEVKCLHLPISQKHKAAVTVSTPGNQGGRSQTPHPPTEPEWKRKERNCKGSAATLGQELLKPVLGHVQKGGPCPERSCDPPASSPENHATVWNIPWILVKVRLPLFFQSSQEVLWALSPIMVSPEVSQECSQIDYCHCD